MGDPYLDAERRAEITKDPVFKTCDCPICKPPEKVEREPVSDLAFILIGGLMGAGILFTLGVGVWTIALWLYNLFTRLVN